MPHLSYGSPKTKVKESQIHGRGLFARERIAKGEIVAIKGGYIFDLATRDALGARLGPAEIPVAEGLFIGPRSEDERDGSMIFTNHSCDPNIAIEGQIVFTALRDIEAGEELTHDWATTDDDAYEMACNCGTASCRGTVTGQDWRRKGLQEKYRGHFAWYIQRKIEQTSSNGRVPHRVPPTGEKQMILEVASLNVRPGESAAFEKAFAQAQGIISSMPGYISHQLRRCLEAPDKYLLLVEWQRVEDHTVGFRQSAQYQEWKRLLHHFYEPFPNVEHYEPVFLVEP
jgi:hypothetical protein